ncbi:MAG: hypothetical protein EOO70_02680 [Myxococcaceae bacterium]|nr:MAG: hypothetical protein EOO70_02680 [Myxococcaceae bacterium]
MFEIQILIPVASNEGVTFAPAHHDAFEAFVIDRFGGLTFAGTVQGAWLDNGQLYRDTCRLYQVAVTSLTDGGKVGEVVSFAKVHYAQLAICLRYLGIVEIL